MTGAEGHRREHRQGLRLGDRALEVGKGTAGAFGQSSERGKLLIEQLELRSKSLRKCRQQKQRRQELLHLKPPGKNIPAAHVGRTSCRIICRSNGLLSPRLALAVNAARCACVNLAKLSPRRSNVSRGAGKSSSMCERSSRAETAKGLRRRLRLHIRSRLRGFAGSILFGGMQSLF
jgi:hypothetical protein